MIYNYKADETVQDVILECLCPLLEDISDEYSTLRRENSIQIYAPSFIAKEIVYKILEEIEDVWVNEESHNKLLYKDNNEVIITIASDGMIFIEAARGNNNELKHSDGVLNYIYDGFTQKDIEKLSAKGDSILIFGFNEDNQKEDKTLVKYSEDKAGNTHGFTASKTNENGYYSYSFYTSDKLDKKEIHEILNTMGF